MHLSNKSWPRERSVLSNSTSDCNLCRWWKWVLASLRPPLSARGDYGSCEGLRRQTATPSVWASRVWAVVDNSSASPSSHPSDTETARGPLKQVFLLWTTWAWKSNLITIIATKPCSICAACFLALSPLCVISFLLIKRRQVVVCDVH